MAKFEFIVTQVVTVDLDETKFTPEFMEDFRETMYGFHNIDDHAEHLAQLQARGLYDLSRGQGFVEGYGDVKEFGVKAKTGVIDVEPL